MEKKEDSGKFGKPAFTKESNEAAVKALNNGSIKISTDAMKIKKGK